eukprot:gene23295-biopygen8544
MYPRAALQCTPGVHNPHIVMNLSAAAWQRNASSHFWQSSVFFLVWSANNGRSSTRRASMSFPDQSWTYMRAHGRRLPEAGLPSDSYRSGPWSELLRHVLRERPDRAAHCFLGWIRDDVHFRCETLEIDRTQCRK